MPLFQGLSAPGYTTWPLRGLPTIVTSTPALEISGEIGSLVSALGRVARFEIGPANRSFAGAFFGRNGRHVSGLPWNVTFGSARSRAIQLPTDEFRNSRRTRRSRLSELAGPRPAGRF